MYVEGLGHGWEKIAEFRDDELVHIQPADRGSYKYILKITPPSQLIEEYEIDRPLGFNSTNIGLKQNEDGYARHITFDESATYKFTPKEKKLGHQFERIVKEYQLRGAEARMQILVYDEDYLLFIADLDASETETNYIDYFKCKAVISTQKQVIDSKKEVEVNVLSDTTPDNVTIEPLSLSEITLQPKEILAISEYTTGSENFNLDVKEEEEPWVFPFKEQYLAEIKNSLTYEPTANSNTHGNRIWYGALFKLQQRSVIRINIDNFCADMLSFNRQPGGGTVGWIRLHYSIAVFDDNNNITSWIADQVPIYPNERDQKVFSLRHWEKTFDLPKGAKFTIFLTNNVKAEANDYVTIGANSRIRFEAVDIYPSLKTRSTPLIEVGKQIIKSLTNGKITLKSPLFETGRYRTLHALSGYLVRGFPPYNPEDSKNTVNKPFIAIWKDFESVIRNAFNCDWQLIDNEISILPHTEFYKDVEAYRFEKLINRKKCTISSSDNQKYNKLEINYKTCEDNKNNTLDSVHTESNWFVPGSKSTETLTKEIEYIADSYKIEYARREGLQTEGTRSKTEDDYIYMIDTVSTKKGITNATNQYVSVKNVFSPNTIYNLRLTPKRLMVDNYLHFISNLTQLRPTVTSVLLKNTYFKNNGAALTTSVDTSMTADYSSKEIDYISIDTIKDLGGTPIITDKVYEIKMNNHFKFRDMYKLVSSIQSTNGYVTIPFDDGTELQLYVKELDFNNERETLTITGEEKISTVNPGECSVLSGLSYKKAKIVNNNQQFVFSWDRISDTRVTGINLYIKGDNSDRWVKLLVLYPTQTQTVVSDLPMGLYSFRFQTIGGCVNSISIDKLQGYDNIGFQ